MGRIVVILISFLVCHNCWADTASPDDALERRIALLQCQRKELSRQMHRALSEADRVRTQDLTAYRQRMNEVADLNCQVKQKEQELRTLCQRKRELGPRTAS